MHASKGTCCWVLVLIGSLGGSPAGALVGTDCVDYAGYPFVAGSVDTPGEATEIAIAGAHAIVADGSGGLQVVDLSDPTSPVIVGSLSLVAPGIDVAMSGSVACVIGDATLSLVDVSAPTSPVLLASLDVFGTATCVAASESHAFVGTPGTVEVVDVDDPAAPVVVASIPLLHPNAIAVAASRAYVAGDHRFKIFDVTDPATPIVIGDHELGSPGRFLLVDESIVHLVLDTTYPGRDYLYTIDATDPAILDVLEGDSIPAVEGLAATDDQYFLSRVAEWSGVNVVDIATYRSIDSAGFVRMQGTPGDIAITGETVVVASGTAGLQLADRRQMGAISMLPSRAHDVEVQGTLVVAGGWQGVLFIDVSDPLAPVEVGRYDQGFAEVVELLGDYVYAGGSEIGFRVIDMSDPTAPVETASALAGQFVQDIRISGDFALVAAGGSDDGVHIFDASTPATPTYLGVARPPIDPRDLACAEGLLYSAEYGRLRILDISGLPSTSLVGEVTFDGVPFDMAVQGSHAYLMTSEVSVASRFLVVDVSNPTNPTLVYQEDVPEGSSPSLGLGIRGNHAYVGFDDVGFTVFDISDPTLPEPIARHEAYAPRDFEFANGVVYVANLVSFWVVPEQCGVVSVNASEHPGVPGARLSLGRPFPSPSRGASLISLDNPVRRRVRAELFDVGGRRVTSVLDEALDAGVHTIELSLANRTPGVYFLRVEADGERATRSVVLNP